ncbi:hypothetical protein PM082_015381 [Marasmius tenuissimus]|nr:hypothetical protein PM082_015381 [Marasmius tenuissimus]
MPPAPILLAVTLCTLFDSIVAQEIPPTPTGWLISLEDMEGGRWRTIKQSGDLFFWARGRASSSLCRSYQHP